ncbi:hypothetical protein XU18_0490 [Perkinsela sp. CCAP 1560/4]|nr:hypothetical protein XU18_0490 [Perkinsela sp. CCAP 1560/4]|eukprot:KNH09212.1 hypothetical protein XU18_0490 [Perkinsela sp. CCAP 1560/4]
MTKPFLVVLGLRGTLLERLNIQETTSAIQRRPNLTFAKYNAWLRPGILHTLEKLSQVSDLAIWSATPHRNTVPLVSMAFPNIDFKFVWHREHTTTDNIKRLLPADDTRNRFSVIKDLNKIYEEMPQYSPERTVMVDDTIFKTRCHSGNVILLPTYDVNCVVREPAGVDESALNTQAAEELYRFIKEELIPVKDVRDLLPKRLL